MILIVTTDYVGKRILPDAHSILEKRKVTVYIKYGYRGDPSISPFCVLTISQSFQYYCATSLP